MITAKLPTKPVVAAVGAAVAALALLAGCSSGSTSSSNSSGAVAAAPTSSVAASSSPSIAAAVSTATGPLGAYLVDSTGKAIYILTSDKPGGASACTAACLKAWPPIPAPAATPSGIAGITATFGTFTAADGASEMTINGYPAYNFVKDTGPGTIAGQGIVSFGGTWWLLSPSGSFITTAAPKASASSSAAVAPSY
jgi:predicted lipoprotein with Yx(FWY)xxD motif